MANQTSNLGPISIRPGDDGRYVQLLQVCDSLRFKYGSATNALAQLAQAADEYRETLAQLEAAPGQPSPTRDKSGTAPAPSVGAGALRGASSQT